MKSSSFETPGNPPLHHYSQCLLTVASSHDLPVLLTTKYGIPSTPPVEQAHLIKSLVDLIRS